MLPSIAVQRLLPGDADGGGPAGLGWTTAAISLIATYYAGNPIPCNWENPIDINNTGTVAENISITLGTISVSNGGVDGDVLNNLDQALIWAGWGAGAVLGHGTSSRPRLRPGLQSRPPDHLLHRGHGRTAEPRNLCHRLGSTGRCQRSRRHDAEPYAWSGARRRRRQCLERGDRHHPLHHRHCWCVVSSIL